MSAGMTKLFIGGEWSDAEGGRTFEDRDPFTGELVAEVAAGTRADAHRAIEAAAAAVPGLGAVPSGRAAEDLPQGGRPSSTPPARDRRPARAGDRRDFGFGMFQTRFRPRAVPPGRCARLCPDRPGDPVRHRHVRDGHPPARGVVGAFAPWNAALILSARSIAAPLALGNTVVLKPSEWSPIVGGLIWGEIFAEAGLPPGVLNIVTHAPGDAGPIGAALDRDPAVRRLNFTGSSAVGRMIAEQAGRPAEARRPRARRPQPADRARRRRPRVRRERLGLRRLPAPGPDLHVDAPDLRRAADRGRVHLEADGEDRRA